MINIIEIIMAFDFGIKRIGVAIGQKLTRTTQPIGTLKTQSGHPNWQNIEYIYNLWKPSRLIVGLPLKIDGGAQAITILSKQFAKQLQERFQITVEMHDERFTTIEARSNHNRNYYYNYDYGLKKIKKIISIDSIAAEIILQSWLNHSNK